MLIKKIKPQYRTQHLFLLFGIAQLAICIGLLIEHFGSEQLAFYAGMMIGFGTVGNLFYLALAGKEIRRRRDEGRE